MTITTRQYFGIKIDHPDAERTGIWNHAVVLLEIVNALLAEAAQAGHYNYELDPDTGTQISGARGGAGDGGFRLLNSTIGALLSAHKQAQAIDIYDPLDQLDLWLTDEILARYGLYREHPSATPGWSHLQTVLPGSGKRTFYP